MICIAGESIQAGSTVMVDSSDGKAYAAGMRHGALIGNAVEELREGFKVRAEGGEVREDDA